MGRPRGFDDDVVLDRVVQQFSAGGFEGTSVADLQDATGLGRQSLYGAFGGKEELYAAALARYVVATTDAYLAELASPGPVVPRLEALLAALVDAAVADDGRTGCFVVNAVCERGGSHAATTRTTAAVLRRWEDGFGDALRGAVLRGELDDAADPVALARYLVAAVQGLRVLGRARPERDVLADAARVALAPVLAHRRRD